MPKRIQMSRQRPWRAENPDAVIVARPSKWGNPWKVSRDRKAGGWNTISLRVPVVWSWFASKDDAIRAAVNWFNIDLTRTQRDEIRAELAGHDLACWCPLDQPCHADVLLEIANRGAS